VAELGNDIARNPERAARRLAAYCWLFVMHSFALDCPLFRRASLAGWRSCPRG
jgi:hypothetical protein